MSPECELARRLGSVIVSIALLSSAGQLNTLSAAPSPNFAGRSLQLLDVDALRGVRAPVLDHAENPPAIVEATPKAAAAKKNAEEERFPIQLFAGVAVPHKRKRGSTVSFAIAYRWVTGAANPDEKYLWEIRNKKRQPTYSTVKLNKASGTLKGTLKTPPGQGPFEARLVRVDQSKKVDGPLVALTSWSPLPYPRRGSQPRARSRQGQRRSAAAGPATARQFPLRLKSGAALPQSLPTGTAVGFSVVYFWTGGATDPQAVYVWEIKDKTGKIYRTPKKLKKRSGTLQRFLQVRPEQKPFESRISRVVGQGQALEPLTRWTPMH